MPSATAPRRIPLDRATVIESARDLLDEQGLPAFSMTQLGQRLGVSAMALYRYVNDRADLEEAVVESVLGDLAVEDESDNGIATWMHRVRAHWLEHPWLGSLLGSSSSLNRSWVTALEHLAGALERAGLEVDDVARELVRISRTTCGLVIQEIAAPLPQAGGVASVLSRYADGLRRYDNEALFDDLVAETLARVRRLGSGN